MIIGHLLQRMVLISAPCAFGKLIQTTHIIVFSPNSRVAQVASVKKSTTSMDVRSQIKWVLLRGNFPDWIIAVVQLGKLKLLASPMIHSKNVHTIFAEGTT